MEVDYEWEECVKVFVKMLDGSDEVLLLSLLLWMEKSLLSFFFKKIWIALNRQNNN